MTKYPTQTQTTNVTVVEQTGTATLTLSGPSTGNEDTLITFTGKLTAVTNVVTTPFALPGESLSVLTSLDQTNWTVVLPGEGNPGPVTGADGSYNFQIKFNIGGNWYVKSRWAGGSR